MPCHIPKECRKCQEYYKMTLESLKFIKNQKHRERLQFLFNQLWEDNQDVFYIIWNNYGTYLRYLYD